MLINLSNHPSDKWSEEQISAAKAQFGEVLDIQFPTVNPDGDENYIKKLADEYCEKCFILADGKPFSVHLMGEMTLTFAIMMRLQAKDIKVFASTTERIVIDGDGRKMVVFNFVKFRKYEKY